MSDHSLSIFDHNLNPSTANHQPLTPLTFLEWAETVYPRKTAVVYGDTEYTYREFARRSRLLASALSKRGIGPGDTVALMAPNTPPMLEAHFGVPMIGAVLNGINIRLDAPAIAFILEHGEARVLVTDREFSPVVQDALARIRRPITVIDVDDPFAPSGELVGETDYESFLSEGEEDFRPPPIPDEWQAIALNYTSGTTGNPKGAVFHHRGAFLNALGNAMMFGLNRDSVYLWTLPMFHCNGWTYTWAVTAVAGTHVCLRRIDPAVIFSLIKKCRITHMCGAPVVLGMLIHAPDDAKQRWDHVVEIATGGAAPPSPVIAAMEGMGFRVTHLYGLTETYGPASICAWQDDWLSMPTDEKASMLARQGVRYPTLAHLAVANPETLAPVPEDGWTIGEIMMRGNTVMKGYLKNPDATNEAFAGGWFHSGDLAVVHPDHYIEIKDRSKDIIISGGENISSLEVEEVLYRHPKVMEAAVVAKHDEKWGETPCAFVTPRPDSPDVTEDELISWCRDNLAHFKAPRKVVLGPLPKTSTGKIQKFTLRERANTL